MSEECMAEIYCIRDMKERCWIKKCPKCGSLLKKYCIADDVKCECGFEWPYEKAKSEILKIALIEQEKMC